MWKRITSVALTVAGTLVLLPLAIGWARYDYGFLDSQVAFYCITDGGTLYADGYSEEGFRSVERGMSKQNVREILGEPIVRPWFQGAHGDPSKWWYAFQRRPRMNAHRRCIEFGPDDRVTGRVSEPNID